MLASPDQRAAVRSELGLDDPFFVQYGKMMRGLVTGQLKSFKSKQSTLTILRDAFPTTALVGGLGIACSVVLGLLFGVIAGNHPGGWVDPRRFGQHGPQHRRPAVPAGSATDSPVDRAVESLTWLRHLPTGHSRVQP